MTSGFLYRLGQASIVIAFACLLLCVFWPSTAHAFGQDDVSAEFTASELRGLLVETSYDECEFVMYDYESDSTSYLAVRDEYSQRYAALVGSDSVDIVSETDGAYGALLLDQRELEQIEDTSVSPWCDLLYLENAVGSTVTRGSGFAVTGSVAVTAGHCVYVDGTFGSLLMVQSGVGGESLASPVAYASYVVVSREWVDSASEGVDSGFDYAHDFALLVFDEDIPGVQGGQFACESISVLDSLGMSVNCAGYLTGYGATEGACAWKNAEDGSIALLDPYPLGNCFRVNLSTEHGMSGGPVYASDGDGYAAVGIVSHESSLLGNFACRVTERLQVLAAWASAGGTGNTDADSGGAGDSATSPGTGGSVAGLLAGRAAVAGGSDEACGVPEGADDG